MALGSNLGEREKTLASAVQAIGGRIGTVTAVSPCYATAPVGAADLPFLNAALVAESRLAPEAVMRVLLAIEAEHGRVRREKWGNRTLDLDVLLWREAGHEVATAYLGDGIELPHPRMLERDFVLVPAVDVAPDWRLTAGGPTLREMATARGFRLTRA